MKKISIAVFLLFAGSTLRASVPDSAQHLDGIAAVVSDSIILFSEVEAYAYLKGQQMRIQDPGPAEMERLRYEALEELIDGKVLLVQAERDTNITVSISEVQAGVENRIEMMLRQNRITQEQLEQILREQQGISLTKFKSELRTQIRQELMKQKVQQLYASPSTITKKEIRHFYNEYKDSLPAAGESIRLSKITMRCDPSTQIRQKAYDKIKAIKEKLDNGADFTETAKQFSDGPNAENGGDLGFISKGTLGLLEFEEKVFSMDVGQISEPFETRLGFHVVTVEEKKNGRSHVRQIFVEVTPDEECYTEARTSLDSVKSNSNSQEEFAQAARSLSDDPVSRRLGGKMKWQTVATLSPSTAKAVNGLEVGDISSIVQEGNALTIYRIDDQQESRPLTLEEDWNEIAQIAERVLAQQKLRDLVKKWRQETFIKINL